MKKMVVDITVLLVLLLTSAAMAEVKAGSVSITPYIGGYLFEGNQDLKHAPVFGLRGGYNFTKHLGLEGYFHYVKSEFKDLPGNPDMKVFGFGIDGLYHFMPESRLVPFLAAGVSNSHYDPEGMGNRNKLTLNYGGGLKYFLTENVALRADVRHVMPLNDRYNDLLYTFGVTFAFGGEKKKAMPVVAATRAAEPAAAAPVAVVRDSDGDGVPDNQDKCPGTPAGVKVDKDGCPLDSDGDGVPDYLDKCPGTPAGVKVDKDGCPLDSDKDGVYDYLDKCPGTPAGVKVDKDGCPLDSDGDGVPDYLDKCPGTPAGVKVDKDGCPPPPAPVEKAIVEKGRATLKVHFDFDKAVVKNQYHDEIGNLAEVLRKYPDLKIMIEGHTDSTGDVNYNERLSLRRAEAVQKYLVEKFGIAASRLSAKGFGESLPVASNATREGRQQNRRVEAAAEYITIIKR
jgi:OOP family OmpA-OmpF porin